MKKLSFLFVIVCMPMSCLAGVSCNTIGDTVYCSGRDSDGNYVSTTTNKIGNTTYTTGRIGDERVNTSSNRIGGTVYTSGSIGDRRVNVSENRIGNTVYHSGSFGDRRVNTSTNRIGAQHIQREVLVIAVYHPVQIKSVAQRIITFKVYASI